MKIDVRERLDSALQLLDGSSTTVEKFESARILIKGINPRIDGLLTECSKHLANLNKLQANELIELSAENLPEQTEEEKKRKRTVLLLIKSFKDLRSEVERVRKELGNAGKQGKVNTAARIGIGAKGAFGLITLAAIVIVGVSFFARKNPTPQQIENSLAPTVAISTKSAIQAIEFNGKKIALTELARRNGPDCDSPHYHALNHLSVTALDGSVIIDPGGCAFGKIKDVKVIEVK
ncbi:MAG TPA: hypothetical protein VLG67_04235 [Candidatus Saccharimonadales bacterium]|nr:hypothetical protein [Candidatus Saccharimonadales bacterium]